MMRRNKNSFYGPNAGIFMLKQLVCIVRPEAETLSWDVEQCVSKGVACRDESDL
jgi:hypothetical protein